MQVTTTLKTVDTLFASDFYDCDINPLRTNSCLCT